MHADAEPDRQPGSRQFLYDLQIGLVRLAAATVLLRVRQAEQASPAERLELRPRECAIALGLGHPRPQFGGSDVTGQAEQRGCRVVARFPVDARH